MYYLYYIPCNYMCITLQEFLEIHAMIVLPASRAEKGIPKLGTLVSVKQHCLATHFGKQTHSEGQCRQWSVVYYTGGSEAEFPLQPGTPTDFCENLRYLKCTAQAHIPKFLKPRLESVKGRFYQVTAMIHNQKGQLVIYCSLRQWEP